MMKKSSIKTTAILTIGIFLASSFLMFPSAPVAHAATVDLSVWCTGTGLSYSSGTCSLTGGTVGMSEDVEVSSGETLSLATSTGVLELFGSTLTIDHGGLLIVETPSCSFAECLVNGGTINNAGNITVDTAAGACGIYNTGTIQNSETITVKDSAVTGTGICNLGTVTNTNVGIIVLRNTGDETLGINNGGTLTNSGNITTATTGTAEGIFNLGSATNYGTLTIQNTGGFGVGNGAGGHAAVFTNYGSIMARGGTDPFDNYDGVLNRECGDSIVGTTITTGTVNTYACGPAFLHMQETLTNIESSISGLSLGTVSSEIATLQNDLHGNFTSLSSGVATLTTDLTNGLSSLTSAVSTLQSTADSISTTVSGIQTSLSSDFSSLSSAIAGIGSSGPLAGTSNGASVSTVSLTAAPAPTPFSASSWTQVGPTASANEVVSGVSVSTTSGSVTQGVLYVTWTKSGTVGQTYAVDIGGVAKGATPANIQLRFPFSIPSGADVFVQLVSTSKAGADVQLQFVGLPIGGPTTSP